MFSYFSSRTVLSALCFAFSPFLLSLLLSLAYSFFFLLVIVSLCLPVYCFCFYCPFISYFPLGYCLPYLGHPFLLYPVSSVYCSLIVFILSCLLLPFSFTVLSCCSDVFFFVVYLSFIFFIFYFSPLFLSYLPCCYISPASLFSLFLSCPTFPAFFFISVVFFSFSFLSLSCCLLFCIDYFLFHGCCFLYFFSLFLLNPFFFFFLFSCFLSLYSSLLCSFPFFHCRRASLYSTVLFVVLCYISPFYCHILYLTLISTLLPTIFVACSFFSRLFLFLFFLPCF